MKWRNDRERGRSTLAVLVLLAIGWALGIGLYLYREQGRQSALVMAGTAAALQTLTALWASREVERRDGHEGRLSRRAKEGPPRDLYAVDGNLWQFVEDSHPLMPPPQDVGGMKG